MDNNLVVKANELVLASYAMTRHEQNLLIACISQIDSRKAIEDDKSFVITVEQAKDLFYDNYELGIVLANLNGLRITNTAFHLYRKIVLDSISIVKKGGVV